MLNTATLLFIAMVILQALDVVTTLTIISRGGHEQNGIVVRLFAWFGMKSALIVKSVLISGLAWFMPVTELALLVVFYVGIILHNAYYVFSKDCSNKANVR